MRKHTITVRMRHATIDDTELVSGTVGEDRIELDLDTEWSGLDIAFALRGCGRTMSPAKLEDGTYVIPWEVMTEPGQVVPVIEGMGDGTLLCHASCEVPFRCVESDVVGIPRYPGDPSETEWRNLANEARRAARECDESTQRVNQNESNRTEAEAARADAESKRARAESARASEETKRTQAEESRKSGESKRAAAESKRVEAETARASSEESRKSEESKRAADETSRAQAEGQRSASETSRAGRERERIAAETARAEAERGRASAETARARAESARADAQAKNNADQALNNEQMKKLSPVILQGGQYDRATLKPTIEGEPNRMYFVPMVAPAAIELYDLTKKQVEAGNLYVEWMWVGGKWEQMGQSEIKARPISTDQVDAVFSGAHPTGDDVLNLTGLDYTHGKVSALLDGKADKAHQHAVADVTGLRGELDGKAGTGHKHGAGDITSGTLHVDRVPELPIAKVNGLQGALDGKQPKGSYAASSHTHAISNVSGLQGALDGKQPKGSYANASHRHSASEIDGLPEAGGIRLIENVADMDEVRETCLFMCKPKPLNGPPWPSSGRLWGICIVTGGYGTQLVWPDSTSQPNYRPMFSGVWQEWGQ